MPDVAQPDAMIVAVGTKVRARWHFDRGRLCTVEVLVVLRGFSPWVRVRSRSRGVFCSANDEPFGQRPHITSHHARSRSGHVRDRETAVGFNQCVAPPPPPP